jgi:hypothetical protein
LTDAKSASEELMVSKTRGVEAISEYMMEPSVFMRKFSHIDEYISSKNWVNDA